MSAPRLLLSCLSEDRPEFHARVELLVGSARRLGGSLSASPIVVNMLASADPSFVRRLEALDAEVRVVERLGGPTAHANKLRMLAVEDRDDFDVLLAVDCDIAVAGDPAALVSTEAIGVVPADMDPLSERQWRRLFAGLALDCQERSLRANITARPLYPYFNSGVVAVPRELCAGLHAAWTQAVSDLEELWKRHPRTTPRSKRFFCDQYALMAALARGLPWVAASPALNFATHVELAEATVSGVEPVLLHYHAAVDADGFLLRPRSPVAESAAQWVNRNRAEALGLAYRGLRSAPNRITPCSWV